MAPTQETVAISPAQIAALAISVFAIIVFTSISIYLCGRRRGSKEATQRSHYHHHHHHHHHQHARLPDDVPQNANGGGGVPATGRQRFRKLKEAFRIWTAEAAPSSAAVKEEHDDDAATVANAQGMRAMSPIQIQVHPGTSTSNPHSSTDEFQAAVHNLLGYQPGELQEWYSQSDDDNDDDDDDGERQENHAHRHGQQSPPPADHCGLDLPPYEEVDRCRFSWQADESTYRPEKR